MKVSVALASFNGANYILDQLTSIANQSQLPDELVISDDCSTDDTLKIIRQFAETAPFPLKIIPNGINVGQPRNFGRAFESCTGDLIFFCDQDNSWPPNRVERICEFYANNQNALVVTTDAYITNQSLKPFPRTLFERGRVNQKNLASLHLGCCMAFRSSILPIFMPLIGNGMSLDGIIHFTGVLIGQRHTLNEPLLYFRRHSTNVSESILYPVNIHSWMRLVKSTLTLKRPNYQETVTTLEAITNRIERSEVFGVDVKLVDAAKAQMRVIRQPYLDRRDILTGHFLGRKVRQIRFFLAGQYKNFDGLRSLLIDFILR